MESLATEAGAETLTLELADLDPKVVEHFAPTNVDEQKRAFLADETRNPRHTYGRLEAVDFSASIRRLDDTRRELATSALPHPLYAAAYEACLNDYQAKTNLMRLAHDFTHTTDSDKKAELKQAYMDQNSELYGIPEETTYRSLLQEKLASIAKKDLHGYAAQLREELMAATTYTPGEAPSERYRPDDETVTWMHAVAESMYGGLLRHIPNQQKFSPADIAHIFQTMLGEEFGEAAADWTVELHDARSITVRASNKTVIIPNSRGEVSQATLRKLTVHELGVHALRAIQGYETDLPILATGLDEYYDAEEGLGVIMEQALSRKYVESGVGRYITAGAAYFDGKDFRDLFEMKWRLSVLEKVGPNEEITEATVNKARSSAYRSVMRSMRGTDELPLFKDLSYYNGTRTQWQYLGSIRGDDTLFMLVMLGKVNPANAAHQRILLETASV